MIRSQQSIVMLLVAYVMQQIKQLLKLIVVLLGFRAQKALFTPANYCINDFILIRFYKIVIYDISVKSEILFCKWGRLENERSDLFFIQLVCVALKNAVVFLMFILISAAKIR
jgi:hypothetical protein